jgi:hypothetical protein
MWEFVGQVVLLILGAAIPPIVTKVVLSRLEKTRGVEAPMLNPNILRISLLSTAISFFLGLFLIYSYDNGLLPFTRVAKFDVVKNSFNVAYENRNRVTMLVTISAVNSIDAYTMYAYVADNPSKFGTPEARVVATTSFPKAGHHEAMTFLVPRGWWYQVKTDGGSISFAEWTEYVL